MSRSRNEPRVDDLHAGRRDPKRLFGIAPATLQLLKRLGYLQPGAGRGSDYEFQDLVVLRTVGALRAAKLSTRSIHRALRHLRPWLSRHHPLSGVSLKVLDDHIAVRDLHTWWRPDSGQYALALENAAPGAQIMKMPRRKTPKNPAKHAAVAAHDHYRRAIDLEDTDTAAAIAAYRACLEGDCTHLNARINLGRLLHLAGKHRDAESIYRQSGEPSAELYFNLGVLLHDLGRHTDAIAAYRNALAHEPGMADAHFNLALLHDRGGEAQAAFRHLLAYRRLTAGASS